MKSVQSDAFTFQVALVVDQQLSEKIGEAYTSNEKQKRLVAAMFALHDTGFAFSESNRRSTVFAFSQQAVPLDKYGYIPQPKLEELAEHKILLKLKRSALSHSIELSKRYLGDLDMDLVRQSWNDVGSIIDYVLGDAFRLIGPASKGGLIIEHITRSTPDEKCYVWFALGGNAQKSVMVDLGEPVMFQSESRFPAKHDEHLYVTLGISV